MQLKSTRHSVYLCNYHIVFIPKYRRPVLTGKIAEKLKEIFYEIADKYEMEIIAVEVMPDHIHLFVSAPPRYAPSQIVKYFKGISSKWLKRYFPEFGVKGSEVWTRAYFVSTAGNVSSETIKQYIEMQWERENEKRNQS